MKAKWMMFSALIQGVMIANVFYPPAAKFSVYALPFSLGPGCGNQESVTKALGQPPLSELKRECVRFDGRKVTDTECTWRCRDGVITVTFAGESGDAYSINTNSDIYSIYSHFAKVAEFACWALYGWVLYIAYRLKPPPH